MADKRDESDESESAAEAPPASDEDTEKGEALPAAGDSADEQGPEPASDDTSAKKDEASDDEDATASKAEAEPEAEPAADDDGDSEPAAAKSGDAPAERPQRSQQAKDKGGASRWWIGLLAVLVIEFYVYGRRGDIEVCVGKQDVHDFSLIGQERTDENRWKFPRCESRVNLGLRSQYDELVEDATNVACRGATLFRNRGEGPQCVAGNEGWTKQVETSYIWPWDSRYYEHLLWFVFD